MLISLASLSPVSARLVHEEPIEEEKPPDYV